MILSEGPCPPFGITHLVRSLLAQERLARKIGRSLSQMDLENRGQAGAIARLDRGDDTLMILDCLLPIGLRLVDQEAD